MKSDQLLGATGWLMADAAIVIALLGLSSLATDGPRNASPNRPATVADHEVSENKTSQNGASKTAPSSTSSNPTLPPLSPSDGRTQTSVSIGATCVPGLAPSPDVLTISVGGKRRPQSLLDRDPPTEFVEDISAQIEQQLSPPAREAKIGLIQVFSHSANGTGELDIALSLWINRSIFLHFGAQLGDIRNPGLDSDPGVDMRMRSFMSNQHPQLAVVEWYYLKTC
jgi:hypothetical protein